MEFSIIQGNPTPDEQSALEYAISLHKREELAPIIQRSTFGSPQLRKPLKNSFQFNARKN